MLLLWRAAELGRSAVLSCLPAIGCNLYIATLSYRRYTPCMMTRPTWNVLLIGGHSGIGKTTLAQHLVGRLAVALGHVDDFRLVLERMTTPVHQPPLHALLTAEQNMQSSPQQLRDALIAVARTMSYALEIVIANHVATNAPMILEGDGLLPELAAQRVYANLDTAHSVRAIFLIEDDEAVLFHNMLARQRGLERLPGEVQRRRVHASWLYGQWLKTEARQHHVPVVPPRPWETLGDRLLQVVQ